MSTDKIKCPVSTVSLLNPNVLQYAQWLPGVLLALFLTVFSTCVYAQQSFSFTQYPASLTSINPNYSLVDSAGGINAIVRKQYVGIEGSPTTLLLNGYLPITSLMATAGLNILNDQLGNEKLTEVNVFFAKSVKVTMNSFLSLSLSGGVQLYKANYSSLDPTGMDPIFANNVDETRPNLGFGIMYYSHDYYIGASLPRITFHSIGEASREDSRNLRNSYYITGAYLANISREFKIKPSVLVAYTKGIPVTTDFSAMLYTLNRLGLGMNYRSTNELAGVISLNTNNMNIGYSFQFGTGKAANFGMGTHELTLGIRFGKDLKSPRLL